MYFKEHGIPHFHVRYNEFKAVFAIDGLRHLDELTANWQILKERGTLKPIKPLE